MALSWMRSMITHPKAVQEFSMALQVIRPTMVDPSVSGGVALEVALAPKVGHLPLKSGGA